MKNSKIFHALLSRFLSTLKRFFAVKKITVFSESARKNGDVGDVQVNVWCGSFLELNKMKNNSLKIFASFENKLFLYFLRH